MTDCYKQNKKAPLNKTSRFQHTTQYFCSNNADDTFGKIIIFFTKATEIFLPFRANPFWCLIIPVRKAYTEGWKALGQTALLNPLLFREYPFILTIFTSWLIWCHFPSKDFSQLEATPHSSSAGHGSCTKKHWDTTTRKGFIGCPQHLGKQTAYKRIQTF